MLTFPEGDQAVQLASTELKILDDVSIRRDLSSVYRHDTEGLGDATSSGRNR